MTIVEEFKMMNDTLARMRIIAAFTPIESEKRERVFEIINTIEDMCLDAMKKNLEMKDLAEEFYQIFKEYENDKRDYCNA